MVLYTLNDYGYCDYKPPNAGAYGRDDPCRAVCVPMCVFPVTRETVCIMHGVSACLGDGETVYLGVCVYDFRNFFQIFFSLFCKGLRWVKNNYPLTSENLGLIVIGNLVGTAD
jgi:hypothetical protein